MRRSPALREIHTYIAECCREWIAPAGYAGTTCGLCGERPAYKRKDDRCICRMCDPA